MHVAPALDELGPGEALVEHVRRIGDRETGAEREDVVRATLAWLLADTAHAELACHRKGSQGRLALAFVKRSGQCPRMPALGANLSDDELDTLLERGLDLDFVYGTLHAVLIAPGMIPPSRWLLVAFGEVPPDPSSIGLLLRLYNHVGDLLRRGRVLVAEANEGAACVAFSAGYAAGAALDPTWFGDADRWTFAAPLAYLGGRHDLLTAELLADYAEHPERRELILRDLDRLVITTYSSFAKHRAASAEGTSRPRAAGASVGRNEICPCGSGKKYKRCCLDSPA